ncbi:MAG: DegT/DnrJ/EryC1/StrS family aminotransferase [Pseudomonadota bacterium]
MNIPIFRSAVSAEGTVEAVILALSDVLRSGSYVLGANVAALEAALSQRLAAREVVAVNSGSDALKLALQALGVGSAGGGRGDDEVILPSYTFAACMEAVLGAGAIPVLVDSQDNGFAPGITAWQRARSPRTRAVLGVGLFGDARGTAELADWCRQENVYLVEDIAQCFGASDQGQAAGTWGDAAAMSFYPTKTLGAAGDAGAVAFRNPGHARRARLLRNHGYDGQEHRESGHNSRMDELQAAVLRIMLQRLPDDLQRRRWIASRYLQSLRTTGLTLPDVSEGHAWNYFVVLAGSGKERDRLALRLAAQGVATRVYYPEPLHRHAPYIARFGVCHLPHSERLAQRSLALPLYPALTDDEIAHVIQAVQTACVE